MKKLILPKGVFFVALLVICLVMALQLVAYKVKKGFTEVGEKILYFDSWSEADSKFAMVATYEGKKVYITDPEVIRSYLKNPRPLQGILYGDGSFKPLK